MFHFIQRNLHSIDISRHYIRFLISKKYALKINEIAFKYLNTFNKLKRFIKQGLIIYVTSFLNK